VGGRLPTLANSGVIAGKIKASPKILGVALSVTWWLPIYI